MKDRIQHIADEATRPYKLRLAAQRAQVESDRRYGRVIWYGCAVLMALLAFTVWEIWQVAR